MPEFLDFEAGQTQTDVVMNTAVETKIQFTNSGETFSWSIENPDGDNRLAADFRSISFVGSVTSEVGGDMFAAAGTPGSPEVFVLKPDNTGTGRSQLFGDTANPISLSVNVTNDTWQVQFVGATNQTFNLNSSGVHNLTNIQGQFTEIRFSVTSQTGPSAPINVRGLQATVNCFCAGTLIETANGPVAVEDLCAGDVLRCADGGDTTVHWLGRRPVDGALNDPSRVNPICITAGALGHGLPARDLRVSPDHAIEIDGLLINALALVNGATIYQERGVLPDGFTYYHVETDAHDLILAEGAAAESFVDYTSRGGFENGDQATGRVIPEMPLPRISSARMVPIAIRQRLNPPIAAE